MVNNEKDLYRSDHSHGPDVDATPQKTNLPEARQTGVEDLGAPAMGWMPRAQIRALVQKIDADLKASKAG